MDIVYPLGVSSIWDDNELRYSLRSVEKYVQGYNNIWIIGEKPSFLKNINHIPFEDQAQNKEANICRKILRACDEPSISDDFLFFNDDHFILKPFVANQLPYYYKGDLVTMANLPRRGLYFRAIRRTVRELQRYNYPVRHFDTHTPIIYNKQKFKQVMSQYDWEVPCGMVIKSTYCNSLRIEGIPEPDCKIGGPMTKEDLLKTIEPRQVFSIGNTAINQDLRTVLDTLYPTPSRYEI